MPRRVPQNRERNEEPQKRGQHGDEERHGNDERPGAHDHAIVRHGLEAGQHRRDEVNLAVDQKRQRDGGASEDEKRRARADGELHSQQHQPVWRHVR